MIKSYLPVRFSHASPCVPPSEIVKGTFKTSVCMHDIYRDDLRRIPVEKCAIKCEDARVVHTLHT